MAASCANCQSSHCKILQSQHGAQLEKWQSSQCAQIASPSVVACSFGCQVLQCIINHEVGQVANRVSGHMSQEGCCDCIRSKPYSSLFEHPSLFSHFCGNSVCCRICDLSLSHTLYSAYSAPGRCSLHKHTKPYSQTSARLVTFLCW